MIRQSKNDAGGSMFFNSQMQRVNKVLEVIGMSNLKTSEIELKRYVFPRKYFNTDEQYEFVLVDEGGKILLKDQGRTVRMLDKVFELREKDVIENLVKILKKYDVVRKEGCELFVEIDPWDGNTEERENQVLNKAIFTLFACISFMEDMRIFYN
jgi:hypothetical protein